MKANQTFKIIERNLTESEAQYLVEEIKKTPNITGYTKREWLRFSKLFICEMEGELAGVCAIADINRTWSEIAVIFVKEKFRGNGIGKELFLKANNYLSKKNIYCSSRNPIIIRLMKESGYKTFSKLTQLPFSINLFNIKWILSAYRLKEGYRKKYINKSMDGFIYGIKINN